MCSSDRARYSPWKDCWKRGKKGGNAWVEWICSRFLPSRVTIIQFVFLQKSCNDRWISLCIVWKKRWEFREAVAFVNFPLRQIAGERALFKGSITISLSFCDAFHRNYKATKPPGQGTDEFKGSLCVSARNTYYADWYYTIISLRFFFRFFSFFSLSFLSRFTTRRSTKLSVCSFDCTGGAPSLPFFFLSFFFLPPSSPSLFSFPRFHSSRSFPGRL